ncbi:GAF domain-containing protein [Rubrimonas cliftonensis]|uniref:histidine kinase n=1 Tax=Rubrimonas cliftonensis TaxID=89524 RepID=A0A1H3VTM0_9RHOB|nr:GAF domain-containing protein [Rubrimonas cliftonensis]SDZ77462.1 GAF domain-containing protein [Rubrimonas cliftonensis]
MAQSDALREIGLLDGEAEPSFDRLLRWIAHRLGVEVVLLSVIDEQGDRQFFKSALGLAEPWASQRQTPLSHSFCRLVAATDAPVVIRDAREDERVYENPAIADLGVIAYLGVPVAPVGRSPIGALCAIGSTPRDWTAADLDDLRVIADSVSNQISLKLSLRAAEKAQREIAAVSHALNEANRRFADLAANVPGAIFRYLARPGGRDAIEYMSPGCVDIWEIPAERLMGDPKLLWEAVESEDLTDTVASVRRSAQDLTPWRHRWRIVTPSGQTKWLQGYGAPRRLDDGSVLWNTLILDITVEVAAQRELTETVRMLNEARKQEVIGRLAGGVAHDFNDLLTTILGNAELAMETPEAHDRDGILSEIRAAALRGAELNQSLLSFARRSTPNPTMLDTNDAIS